MEELSERLNSFAEWPDTVPVKPKHLAEAGFYYIGEDPTDDTVRCFSCNGKLNGWRAGDIPERRHRIHFGAYCEFIRERDIVLLEREMAGQRNDFRQHRFDPIVNDDMENEAQRLLSFQRNNGWPGLVEPRKLAAAGFYYTGINDNVKCCACDVSLCRWQGNDDPVSEHLRNQPNCPFLSRLHYHSQNPSGTSLNEVGIFHHTRPNYTETIQVTGPSVSGNRPTDFRSGLANKPGPSFTGPTRSLPLSANWHHQRKSEPVSGQQVPDYSKEKARLHSFINWPKECPVQPKELIDAGFYYTGEGDKARCFKCGITLAGWEPEDTPWGEHQKWSKDCALVTEHLCQRNPHSPVTGTSGLQMMPQEQSWQSPNEPKHFLGKSESPDYNPALSVGECSGEITKPSRTPMEQCEKSYQEDISKTCPKTKTDVEIFHIQKAVQELCDRGYDLSTIEETIQYKTKVCNESIDSVEELLAAVLSFMETNKTASEEKGESTAPNRSEGINPCSNTDDSLQVSEPGMGITIPIDPVALHEQVIKMKEAHMCKICLDAEIGVVFLPCGHLVCCPNCAAEIQAKRQPICPVCRRNIVSTIRTYLP